MRIGKVMSYHDIQRMYLEKFGTETLCLDCAYEYFDKLCDYSYDDMTVIVSGYNDIVNSMWARVTQFNTDKIMLHLQEYHGAP